MAQHPDDSDDRQDRPRNTPDLREADNLTEVYRTDNSIAASVAIDEILGPAGIEAYQHDRQSHAIPAPVSMPGEIGIAVPRTMAERARKLLREARTDGILQEDGQIVEGEAERAQV